MAHEQGNQTRVIIEDLSNHPRCKHGPMLLFSQSNSSVENPHQFYACSAFRDSKSKCDPIVSNLNGKPDDNLDYMIRLQQILEVSNKQRGYCFNCKLLLLSADFPQHERHTVQIGIEDSQLKRPTTLLNPISNDKREAQYFFAESTLKCIVNILKRNALNAIICIGAPRLHEYLKSNYHTLSIKSILLDFDDRYKSFYSSNEFILYNMFNHHFFDGTTSEDVFNDFLRESNNNRTCLFTDPPFGCRTEPLAFTIKQISTKYRQINSFNDILPVIWIFPYFMETYIQNEMSEMEMVDYKINYTNHQLYHDGERGRKHGSPVRLFTNIPLNTVCLPESEGYSFCNKCFRWTSAENVHCVRCRKCPSKNGSTYIHCNQCELCVKPNYKHCRQCGRCTQISDHKCDKYQRDLTCWICRLKGHNEINCTSWFRRNKRLNNIRKQLQSNRRGKVEKICFICAIKGHNEKCCKKRKDLLQELTFINVTENIFSR